MEGLRTLRGISINQLDLASILQHGVPGTKFTSFDRHWTRSYGVGIVGRKPSAL